MKYFLLLFFSLAAYAAEDEGFVVEVDPGTYPVKAFSKNKKTEVGKKTEVRAMKKMKPHPDAIPDARKRDQVFARVKGLATHIDKLDQLDRDMLYMRAKKNSFADLRSKYPKIPEKLLAQLQKESKRASGK